MVAHDPIAPEAQRDVDLVARADLTELGFTSSKPERRQIARLIVAGERPVHVVPGLVGKRSGLLTLTTTRSVFVGGRSLYGLRRTAQSSVQQVAHSDLASFLLIEGGAGFAKH